MENKTNENQKKVKNKKKIQIKNENELFVLLAETKDSIEKILLPNFVFKKTCTIYCTGKKVEPTEISVRSIVVGSFCRENEFCQKKISGNFEGTHCDLTCYLTLISELEKIKINFATNSIN